MRTMPFALAAFAAVFSSDVNALKLNIRRGYIASIKDHKYDSASNEKLSNRKTKDIFKELQEQELELDSSKVYTRELQLAKYVDRTKETDADEKKLVDDVDVNVRVALGKAGGIIDERSIYENLGNVKKLFEARIKDDLNRVKAHDEAVRALRQRRTQLLANQWRKQGVSQQEFQQSYAGSSGSGSDIPAGPGVSVH